MSSAPRSTPSAPSAPDARPLAERQPSERIQGVFSIANAQLGRTKTEKPYLRCLIGDRSAQRPARMWSIDEATFAGLPVDGFVYLEGETQAYQGELQVIIHKIEATEPGPDQLRDLLPATERDPAEMLAELRGLLLADADGTAGGLQHPGMRALCEIYFDDAYLIDQLCTAPAAKSLHHARLGGLLEHTLSVVRLAHAVCPLYPGISRDLVIMGLFLHDLGKTRELSYDKTFGYTTRGELIGHVVEGVLMLHDKSQQLMASKGVRLPPGALNALQHIIASHHGEPEHGAARRPATPEAILVHLLDNVDAKTTMALEAVRRNQPDTGVLRGEFTEKIWALETKLFRPDPLA